MKVRSYVYLILSMTLPFLIFSGFLISYIYQQNKVFNQKLNGLDLNTKIHQVYQDLHQDRSKVNANEFRNEIRAVIHKKKHLFNSEDYQDLEILLNQSINDVDSFTQNFLLELMHKISISSGLLLDSDPHTYLLSHIYIEYITEVYRLYVDDSNFVSVELLLKNAIRVNEAIKHDLEYLNEKFPEKTKAIKEQVLNIDKTLKLQLIKGKTFEYRETISAYGLFSQMVYKLIQEDLFARKESYQKTMLITLIFNTLVWVLGSFFVFKIFRDQQVIRQALEHSERLNFAGQIINQVAHEINNPLMAIKSELYKIQKEVLGGVIDDVKIKERVTKTNRSVDRITKITKSINKLSRKKTDEEFKQVKVDEMISESVYYASFKNGDGSSKITFESDQIEILGDEFQIEQAIINLISNALDAISGLSEKWIKVEARKVNYFIDDEEFSCLIKITDSGLTANIPNKEKMFEEFYTTKKIGHGTGLGLSIVQEIIRNHHGKIELDINAVHTTFKLYFK